MIKDKIMKRLLFGMTLVAFMVYYASDAAMIRGRMPKITKAVPGRIDIGTINFVEEIRDYVDGGLTFTYPVGMFAGPPCILVTAELKDMVYTATEVVVAEITNNTATQTDVRINKVGDIIEEAATNEVTVHFAASGSP